MRTHLACNLRTGICVRELQVLAGHSNGFLPCEPEKLQERVVDIYEDALRHLRQRHGEGSLIKDDGVSLLALAQCRLRLFAFRDFSL